MVKLGVKIDRRSGAAQTDMLRFEEVARLGTVLEAECQLPLQGPERQVASALLLASTKLVERLGGKRRRGVGRCRLEIIGMDVAQAIDWLDKQSAPDWSTTIDGNESPVDMGTAKPSQSSDNSWICVPLVLQLQGPLAVSYRTTGNVVETLDFLPGSYLLPHITRSFPQFRSAVAQGDLIVLPAYPEVARERSQPVPIAWFSPKGLEKPLKTENREYLVNRLLQREPADATQIKQMRVGYITVNPTEVYTTPITVRTHNTVQDQFQRPTSDVGGVYTYEAIAPLDQDTPVVLRSELRIRKSFVGQLEDGWWKKLSGTISLGRSKKDDYGSVRLTAEMSGESSSSVPDRGSSLFVWVVSDLLLRNQRLRPDPSADCLAWELSRVLGVSLRLRTSDAETGTLDELVRVRRLDSWHVGWGLPRPSLVALQAGSCMVFHVDGRVDPKRLAELEISGIGERTAEGYGQVRFNHPLVQELPTEWMITVAISPNADEGQRGMKTLQNVEPSTQTFARRLELVYWQQEIRRKSLALAASASNRNELLGWVAQGEQGSPPMSQLGGLRGQLAMLRTAADDGPQIIDWLNHLAGNSRRKDKWPSITKVKAFIESAEKIWEIIPTTGFPTLTPNARLQLERELWPLAVRTFFDACIRAHKRELESQQNRTEVNSGT